MFKIKPNILSAIFCLFLLLSLSEKTFSQVSFKPYSATPVGSWPTDAAIADLNNDGLNDIVLATGFYFDAANDYKIFVFTQTSSGTLSTPAKYPYSGGASLSGIAVGDFNNDGLNDVVVSFKDSIGIFYQNSSGTLNAVQRYYCKASVSTIKSGDLNHDGLTDIVVSSSDSLRVFYQKAGGFNVTGYNGQGYAEIEIGDMNYDGLNDVVGRTGNNLNIFIQTKAGTFNDAVVYAYNASGFGLSGIAIGDFNDDNRNDVVGGSGGNRPSSQINIWLQDTTGLLNPVYNSINAYDIPEPVEAADLDCDGRTEIVAVNGGWNTVTTYSQDGSNKYNTYQKFSVPYASHYPMEGIAIGDINNDGKRDIVLADYNNGLVVLINNSNCTPVTLAGTVSVTDATCSNKSDGNASVYVNSGYGPYKYNWSTNPPQKSQSVNGLAPGTYTVTVTDSRDSIIILSCTVKSPTLVPLSVTITTTAGNCIQTGTTVRFTASTVNGGTNPSYQWKINGVNAGLNSYSFSNSSLNSGDTITCIVTAEANSCVTGSPAISNTIQIFFGSAGSPGTISAARDTICEGSAGHLVSTGSTGGIYQWQSATQPGQFSDISGATFTTYTTNGLAQTTYYHLIAGLGNCSATSADYKLTVVPSPSTRFTYTATGVKVAFQSTDSLNNISGYNWDFGDSTTSSLKNPIHTYAAAGSYNACLTVYNGSNCSYSFCNIVDVVASGIGNASANNWKLYPNPFNNVVVIQLSNTGQPIQGIKVYDVLGRKMLDENLSLSPSNSIRIDVSSLIEGMYYFEIKSEGKNSILPMIKQN